YSPCLSHSPSPPPLYSLSLHDALPILRPTREANGFPYRFADHVTHGSMNMAAMTCAMVRMRKIDIEKIDNTPMKWRVIFTRGGRSEEHTSELQSLRHLVCRLLLEKKK